MPTRRKTSRLVLLGAAAFVLAGLILGAVLVHRTPGAKYVGSVTPVMVTRADCVSQLTRLPYGFSSRAAVPTCERTRGATWLQAAVRNVGHRSEFLKGCWVVGVSPSGRRLWRLYLSVGYLNFPAGPSLDRGGTVMWRWYLTDFKGGVRVPSPGAERYEAECPVIDYGGKIPV